MIEMTRRHARRLLGTSLIAALLCHSAMAATSAAPQAGETKPSVQLGERAFQQVAVTTRDLPRAIAFYRDVLGLRLLFESNGMAFFDVGGIRLMIGLDAQRPTARPTSVLYFDAPQFLATRAALEALGVPFDGGIETVDRRPGAQLELQQFTDPDGNALAVMGWVEGS